MGNFHAVNILLAEENEIVNDDGETATIINRCFTNLTKHMNFKVSKTVTKKN